MRSFRVYKLTRSLEDTLAMLLQVRSNLMFIRITRIKIFAAILIYQSGLCYQLHAPNLKLTCGGVLFHYILKVFIHKRSSKQSIVKVNFYSDSYPIVHQ